MIDFVALLGCVLVGALWGVTNPFINKGGAGMTERASRPGAGLLRRLWDEMVYLLGRWLFVVPFALNQSGSAVFYYVLLRMEMSLAVPICNSLALAFTALTSTALGEDKRQLNADSTCGIVLILAGIATCLHAASA